MKASNILKLAMVAVVAGLLAANASAIMYQGSLSVADGGLTATYQWNNPATMLSWTVQDVGVVGQDILWQYDYVFSVPSRGISHLIVEVTPESLQRDFSAGLVALYQPTTGGSNPGMPGPMWGLKIDSRPAGSTELSWAVAFTTTHSPVWGDFYAKDGNSGPVICWNTGFLATDPTDPAANGSINNHILRPNGPTHKTPDGGLTVGLLGMALAGIGLVARRLR